MFDPPKPTIIVTADGPVSDTGTVLMEAIASAARQALLAQSAKIEQLLLEGHNEICVKGLGLLEYRYVVPGWREHPIMRLRVEWHRWRFRRLRRAA